MYTKDHKSHLFEIFQIIIFKVQIFRIFFCSHFKSVWKLKLLQKWELCVDNESFYFHFSLKGFWFSLWQRRDDKNGAI